MLKFSLITILFAYFFGSAAWAGSECTDTWPAVLDKIKDLRKLNSCSPEFTLSECRENLGLVGVGAGATAAGKKWIRRPPKSCSGLQRSETLSSLQKENPIWSFLIQSQIPTATAAGVCRIVNTAEERKNFLTVLEKRKEALEKEIEEIKPAKDNWKEMETKYSRVKTLVGAKYYSVNQYLDHVGGPVTPEKIKEILAQHDNEIENFIKAAPAQDREDLKRYIDSQWEAFRMQSSQAGKAHYRMSQPLSSDEFQKLTQKKEALARTEQLIKATPTTQLNHRGFAELLEKAAQTANKEELEMLAEIRMAYAQKAPEVPLKKGSKLASAFAQSPNKKTNQMEARLKNPKLKFKWVGTGLAGMAFSAISIAGEATNEDRTDALAGTVFTTTLGCSGIDSEWIELDSECRFTKEWNDLTAQFVELDAGEIQREFAKDRSGNLCKQIQTLHQKYFSSTTQAQCDGSSMLVKDHNQRYNYTANWDSTGNMTQLAFKGEHKMYREYTAGLDGNRLSSIKYSQGGSKKVQLPAAALNIEADHPVTKEISEHIAFLNPRMLELQACCQGKIADSRCDTIKSRSGSGNMNQPTRHGSK